MQVYVLDIFQLMREPTNILRKEQNKERYLQDIENIHVPIYWFFFLWEQPENVVLNSLCMLTKKVSSHKLLLIWSQ